MLEAVPFPYMFQPTLSDKKVKSSLQVQIANLGKPEKSARSTHNLETLCRDLDCIQCPDFQKTSQLWSCMRLSASDCRFRYADDGP